jgi:ribonuclease P/MRP protein subunit POP5
MSRAHYRLVWAALTFMTAVPTGNGQSGRSCVFRVVHVSGTIRKVEEEAIRRARVFIGAARGEIAGKTFGTLDALFGNGTQGVDRDAAMVDDDDDDDDDGHEADEGVLLAGETR